MSSDGRCDSLAAYLKLFARSRGTILKISVDPQSPNKTTGTGVETRLPILVQARSPVTTSKPSSSHTIDDTSKSQNPTHRPEIIVRLPQVDNSAELRVQLTPLIKQSLASLERYPSHASDTTEGIAVVTPTESTTGVTGQSIPAMQQPYDDPIKESNKFQRDNNTFVNEDTNNATTDDFDSNAITKRIEDMLSATAKAGMEMSEMESVLEAKRELLQYGSENLPAVKKLDVAMALNKQIKAALPTLHGLMMEMGKRSWDEDIKLALEGVLEELNMDSSKLHLLQK